MITRIALTFALFCILTVSSLEFPGACSRLICAKQGEDCRPGIACAWGTSCIDGQCRATELGSPCTTDQECGALEYSCDPNTHTCERNAFAGPGERCKGDSDCLFENVCVEGTCDVRKAGQACEVDRGECPYGYYCNGLCTPYIAEGGLCQAPSPTLYSNENQCGLTLSCLPNLDTSTREGLCGKRYSRRDGERCTLHSHCASMVCDGNLCLPTRESTFFRCNSSSDCLDSEDCTCDRRIGESICIVKTISQPNACKKRHMSLLECVDSNQCPYLALGENSCASKNCGDTYGCYMKECHSSTLLHRLTLTQPENCIAGLPAGHCPVAKRVGLSTAAIVLIICGAIIAAAIVAGLIALFLRRKHTDYELVHN